VEQKGGSCLEWLVALSIVALALSATLFDLSCAARDPGPKGAPVKEYREMKGGFIAPREPAEHLPHGGPERSGDPD
jgi:hypothetical protein